jgi:predicted DNA-binding antitoxin AbrB/MazE fold protein
MTPIDAIYQGGVFRPLEPVDLAENLQVRLSIHLPPATGLVAWREQARAFRQGLFEKYGCFPDMALEIAADRARDE